MVTSRDGAFLGFYRPLASMVQPEVVIGFLQLKDWGLTIEGLWRIRAKAFTAIPMPML